MSSNDNTPDDNNAPLSPEFVNSQGRDLNDNILRSAKWLRGFRIDDAHGPQVSIQQVASCIDQAAPLVEEMSGISTEIIVTNTERETNYVHRGWSIGAVRTVSPWASSRIIANNQIDPDGEGTWYTRMTRSKRFKVQTLLEDLAPVPEFEAAIEEALRQPTTYEKFQAVYRALARWGDVLPIEIEMGSSLALTDSEMDHIQFQLPETGGYNYNNITWLSTFKTSDITITGDDIRWNNGSRATMETREHQWQVITIGKVVSTIDLLPGDLRTRLSELEHITEMLTWTDGNWLFGLQFVTNLGRCSPQYGAHRDIPSVARTKGGVLVGFLSQTNQHPSYKEMFSGVQGIWRHDILPRIPKEDDVYSEYFGDTHSSWHEPAFNDRVLVGNSKSIYISCVKIWSGDSIDSIQFMYDDSKDGQESKSMSLRHGGPGGSPHQFVLEDGEHITTVSGRYGEQRITQLCFATNRGRTSGVFGGGKGQPFSTFAPRNKDGNYFRLQYLCGKHSDTSLTGVVFVWTPC